MKTTLGNWYMKKDDTGHRTTTFQLSDHLHTQIKTMCLLTKKSMGEFIRLSLMEKINNLKNQQVK
jgi:hypothetical protein